MTQEWATYILWKLISDILSLHLWLLIANCILLMTSAIFSTGQQEIYYCKCSFIDYQYPDNFSSVSPRCLFWNIDPFAQWPIGYFHRNIDLRVSHTQLTHLPISLSLLPFPLSELPKPHEGLYCLLGTSIHWMSLSFLHISFGNKSYSLEYLF